MERHSLACDQARGKNPPEQGTDCIPCHQKFIAEMNKYIRDHNRRHPDHKQTEILNYW